MFKGNKALVARKAKEAYDHYTQILYTVCPGHICAFMNRSLAHILMGYPELAVFDAYRATQLCHELRNNEGEECLPGDTVIQCDWAIDQNTDTILEAVRSYLRREKTAIENLEDWTKSPHIGRYWLADDLASCLCWGSSNDYTHRSDLQGLEIRSYYRMVGALGQCGGGAKSEAAGLIDDIMAQKTLNRSSLLRQAEMVAFGRLGASLVDGICIELSHSAHTTPEWKAVLNMRTSMVSRVLYPWDTYTPRLETAVEIKEFTACLDSQEHKTEAYYGRPTLVLPGTIELKAGRDIFNGETVVKEESILRATTMEPGEVQEFPTTRVCDNCKRTFVLTSPLLPPQSTPPKRSSTSEDNNATRESLLGPGTNFTGRVQSEVMSEQKDTLAASEASMPQRPHIMTSSPPTLSTASASLSPPRSVTSGDEAPQDPRKRYACSDCDAEYCGIRCYATRRAYHSPICEGKMADLLKMHYRAALHRMQDEPDRKLVSRVNLILRIIMRVLAMSLEQREHPLNLAPIKHLNGLLRAAVNPCEPMQQGQAIIVGMPTLGPSAVVVNDSSVLEREKPTLDTPPCAQPVQEAKDLAWSYNSNVVIPMTALMAMGVGAYEDLKRYDGWVINTLYAKIDRSIWIDRGSMSVEGKREILDPDDYTGVVYPVCSMTQIPMHEEQVNCHRQEGRTVRIIAGKRRQDAAMSNTGEEEQEQRWKAECAIRTDEHILLDAR